MKQMFTQSSFVLCLYVRVIERLINPQHRRQHLDKFVRVLITKLNLYSLGYETTGAGPDAKMMQVISKARPSLLLLVAGKKVAQDEFTTLAVSIKDSRKAVDVALIATRRAPFTKRLGRWDVVETQKTPFGATPQVVALSLDMNAAQLSLVPARFMCYFYGKLLNFQLNLAKP
ncbi:hypothetical protein Tco_0719526 [Tanacetum coccineum]